MNHRVSDTWERGDPNGYVIELTAKTPGHAQMMDPATNDARAILGRWQAEKSQGAAAD